MMIVQKSTTGYYLLEMPSSALSERLGFWMIFRSQEKISSLDMWITEKSKIYSDVATLYLFCSTSLCSSPWNHFNLKKSSVSKSTITQTCILNAYNIRLIIQEKTYTFKNNLTRHFCNNSSLDIFHFLFFCPLLDTLGGGFNSLMSVNSKTLAFRYSLFNNKWANSELAYKVDKTLTW